MKRVKRQIGAYLVLLPLILFIFGLFFIFVVDLAILFLGHKELQMFTEQTAEAVIKLVSMNSSSANSLDQVQNRIKSTIFELYRNTKFSFFETLNLTENDISINTSQTTPTGLIAITLGVFVGYGENALGLTCNQLSGCFTPVGNLSSNVSNLSQVTAVKVEVNKTGRMKSKALLLTSYSNQFRQNTTSGSFCVA
ncbi:MAG: hypothetical protein N2654_05070 [Deltaproteobacteria bacterium]|nr:hypothetical protein [Deltaproteobacteria bacterium]